jgi:hypothetical protein
VAVGRVDGGHDVGGGRLFGSEQARAVGFVALTAQDHAAMVPGMIDVQLTSIQTAVLLLAILHALAQGQRSHVISRLGVTAGADTLGGPVSLQDVTIRCSDT